MILGAIRRVFCHWNGPSSVYRPGFQLRGDTTVSLLQSPFLKPSLVRAMCAAMYVHRTHDQWSKCRRGFRVPLCNTRSSQGSSSWKFVKSRAYALVCDPWQNSSSQFSLRIGTCASLETISFRQIIFFGNFLCIPKHVVYSSDFGFVFWDIEQTRPMWFTQWHLKMRPTNIFIRVTGLSELAIQFVWDF